MPTGTTTKLGKPRELASFEDVAALAKRAFHVDGDRFVSSTASIEARYDQLLWLTPHHFTNGQVTTGGPLGVYTDSVTVDAKPLPASAPAVSTGPHGELVIDRGSFVERYLPGLDGIEQTWEFRHEPAVGAIEIKVALVGQQLVAQTPSGLHFESAQGLGFGYSHGLWIDATGAEYDVPARWSNGRVVLTVPAEIVANTQFPAVLDPVISAEQAVDVPVTGSPTGAHSLSASVAFSGAQYLVVWRDDRNGKGDIYGTRLSTTGAVLDPGGIAITTAAGVQDRPQVSFVNGQYLVVWEDYKSTPTDPDLVAARVSTTGAVTALGSVGATAVAETSPRLAVRGTEALLVYQRGVDVAAARFSGSTFGAPFTIAAGASGPAVTANPAGDYLVAFTAATDLRAVFVSAAGVAGAAFDVSLSGGTQTQATAAFVGGNYVVAWTNNEVDVYGARVTTAGAVLDTHLEAGLPYGGIPLAAAAPSYETSPSLACLGSGCLLTWEDTRNSATLGYDVYGQMLSSDLTPTASAIAISGQPRQQTQPRVTAAGTGYMAVWQDTRDGTLEQVYGARVSSAGTLLDASGILIARGSNRETLPFAVRGASSWLVGWSDSRVRGNNVMGVRVSNTLGILDNPALAISNATGWQDHPAGAFSGIANGDVLVAWSDLRGSNEDIYAARVRANGTIADPTGIAVSTAAGTQFVPDVASNGAGKFLVVWQDRTGGDFDINGAVLDANGAVVVPSFSIGAGAGDQLKPRVDYDPVAALFFVVWNGAPGDTIFGARVSVEGAVLDANGVQLTTAAGGKFRSALAFGNARFMVAWDDRRNGNADIYGTRVSIRNGVQVEDPNGIEIARAAGKQTDPTIGALANAGAFSFVIAWTDERNLATSRSDVFGALHAEASGTRSGSEFAIATSADEETAPALARKSTVVSNAPTVLVTYQRFVSLSNQRVMVRRISDTSTACELVCPGSCSGNTCNLTCDADGSCVCPPGQPCVVTCDDTADCTGAVDCSAATSCTVECDGKDTCAAGVTCGSGPCNVSCSGENACLDQVDCSSAGACNITCDGEAACAGGVTCGADACNVTCSGASACAGAVTCGTAACDVLCSGSQSCGVGVSCGQSCGCDVTCSGAGACAVPAQCPNAPACNSGAGCTSAPATCETCP